MKIRGWMVVALAVFLGTPAYAHADAGTPLMWATALHLLIGNALVGVLEGALLAGIFSLKKLKTVGIMIGANYFSAWAGVLFLEFVLDSRLQSSHLVDLNNGWKWFWIFAGLSYLATLILELPFVVLCFWKKENWLRASLKGNLIVQTASYAVLFGWYWMASVTSLYTDMKVVPVSEMPLPKIVQIYYIGDTDGDIYTADLDGKNSRKVWDLKSTGKNDRLFVVAEKNAPDISDLMAYVQEKDISTGRKLEVKSHFCTSVSAPKQKDGIDAQEGGSWFNFAFPNLLGEGASTSEWEFRGGFWAAEGFRAINKRKNTELRFGFETLYGSWIIRNITHLPGDIALFQLGERQICVMDPVTKKVALVAFGRGPIAILKEAQ